MTNKDVSMFEPEQKASPVTLKDMMDKAWELIVLERRIKNGEAKLKQLKAEAHKLRTEIVPDVMIRAGVPMGSDFSLGDVGTIKLETFVEGSLPKDAAARQSAIDYATTLEGGTAIIKNDLHIEFDRKEHNQAMALKGDLEERGFKPEISPDINHMTLKAFVRERLKHGDEIEPERLGVFVGKRVVVKLNNNGE